MKRVIIGPSGGGDGSGSTDFFCEAPEGRTGANWGAYGESDVCLKFSRNFLCVRAVLLWSGFSREE